MTMSENTRKSDRAEPKRTFQYLAMITSSINIMTSGMLYGWAAPALPKLLGKDSDIPLTNDEGSWVATSMLFGGICGAILAGFILDRIGRKNVILLCAVPFFACWMLTAFAKSAFALIVARLIGGISDGMTFCTVPMYLAEIADPKIRGLLGTAMIANLSFGLLVINVIGSYLSITTTALISSVFPLVALVTFLWIPESPYYLLMKNDFGNARHSLRVFRGTSDIEPDLQRISKAIEEETMNKGKWLDLFTTKANRKALFIVLGMRAIHQLSGSLPISFYIQIILKETGHDVSIEITSTGYFGLSMTFAILSSFIIDRLGKRPLLFFSISVSGIALLVEGTYFYAKNVVDTSSFTVVPVLALIAFVAAFNLGLQSMPYVLLGELFSTNVKAFAFSFHDIYYCMLSIIASKFFQFTKDEFGMHVPFFAFAGISALGLLFTAFFVPETRGKTLEQIQDDLRGKSHDSKTAEMMEMLKR